MCSNCANLERRIAEVERRLNNMIMRTSAHKTESSAATIRVADGSGFESGSVEYFQGRSGKNASWSPIDEGEQGLLFCPSGDPAQGVFLGGLPSKASPAISGNQSEQRINFGDGSYISYDRSSNAAALNLGQNANISITTTNWTGNLTIDGNVNITKDLTVEGAIAYGAGGTGGTMTGTGNIDITGSIGSSSDITSGGDVTAKSFIEK